MQSTTRTKQKRVGEKTTTKEQIRQNWHWRCEKLGQHTKVTPRPLTSISKGSLKTFYATSFSSVQDGFYALGKASMRSTLSILPTLSPTLPLKRFQCLSDWRRPSLVLAGPWPWLNSPWPWLNSPWPWLNSPCPHFCTYTRNLHQTLTQTSLSSPQSTMTLISLPLSVFPNFENDVRWRATECEPRSALLCSSGERGSHPSRVSQVSMQNLGLWAQPRNVCHCKWNRFLKVEKRKGGEWVDVGGGGVSPWKRKKKLPVLTIPGDDWENQG